MTMSWIRVFIACFLKTTMFVTNSNAAVTMVQDWTIGSTSAAIVSQDAIYAELTVNNELGFDVFDVDVTLYSKDCEHEIFGPDIVMIDMLQKYEKTFGYTISIDKALIEISEYADLFENLRHSHWKNDSNQSKGHIEFCTKVVALYKDNESGERVPGTYRTTKFEIKFESTAAPSIDESNSFYDDEKYKITDLSFLENDNIALIEDVDNTFDVEVYQCDEKFQTMKAPEALKVNENLALCIKPLSIDVKIIDLNLKFSRDNNGNEPPVQIDIYNLDESNSFVEINESTNVVKLTIPLDRIMTKKNIGDDIIQVKGRAFFEWKETSKQSWISTRFDVKIHINIEEKTNIGVSLSRMLRGM